eukprot:1966649-Rhodomonas_salina.5
MHCRGFQFRKLGPAAPIQRVAALNTKVPPPIPDTPHPERGHRVPGRWLRCSDGGAACAPCNVGSVQRAACSVQRGLSRVVQPC